MDAYSGQYLNSMRTVFQNRQLPRCSASPKLFFSLLPLDDVSNHMRPSHRMYDFHSPEPLLENLTRIVSLVFRGEGIGRLSLGKIEIYGTCIQPSNSPQEELALYQQERANKIAESLLNRSQPEFTKPMGIGWLQSDSNRDTRDLLSSNRPRGYSNSSDIDSPSPLRSSATSYVIPDNDNLVPSDLFVSEQLFESDLSHLSGSNPLGPLGPSLHPLLDAPSSKRVSYFHTFAITRYSLGLSSFVACN